MTIAFDPKFVRLIQENQEDRNTVGGVKDVLDALKVRWIGIEIDFKSPTLPSIEGIRDGVRSHFRFPFALRRTGSGSGKSRKRASFVAFAPSRNIDDAARPIPLFDRHHPSVPTYPPPVPARNGSRGWPIFGPPRQRRAESLTTVSTTAR